MKSLTLITLLLALSCPALAPAQSSKFFKDKLGKPAELYRHKTGINLRVEFDDEGQACSISVTDPSPQTGRIRSFKSIEAVANELVPLSMRGSLVGKTQEIGNCINVRYESYERVFIELNENACYEQSVRVLFKRKPCPQHPNIPGLIPTPSLAKIITLSSSDGPQTPSLIFLSQQQEIELALSAGPEHLRTDATVYVFGKKGYERVRSGKNGFTCMVNRDGNQNGDNDLKPTCWDAEGSATIVPVMLRVGELLAQGKTAKEIELDIAGKFSEGHFISPRKTGIAYMLRGDVQYDPRTMAIGKTLFPPHYMIYAPGVSNADIGMNMDAYKRNPSLPLVYSGYSGGSRTAYIIVVASESKAHTH